MTLMVNSFHEIIARITPACVAAGRCEWLPNVAVAPSAFRGTTHSAQLIGDLRQTLAQSQFAAAGHFHPQIAGGELRADFIADGAEFIVLRDPRGRAFDVLTSTGCLRHKGPAVYAMFDDGHFQAAIRRTKTCFLVFSFSDLIALRSLGLAASLATGLDRVGADDLPVLRDLIEENWLDHDPDQLAQEPGAPGDLRSRQQIQSDAQELVEDELMVLVGWSVARGETTEPPGYEAVVCHLRSVSEFLGLNTESKIGIWRPTQQEINAVLWLGRYGQPHLIWKHILHCLKYGAKCLNAPPPLPPRSQLVSTYLRQITLGEEDHFKIDDNARKLLARFRIEVLEPLLAPQDASPDGEEMLEHTCLSLMRFETLQTLVRRQVQRAKDHKLGRMVCGSEEDRVELDQILKLLSRPRTPTKKIRDVCPAKLKQARRRWQRSSKS
jgi:hypothetical protein